MEELEKIEEINIRHPEKYKLANVFISKGAYSWKNIETMVFNQAVSKPEKRYDPQSKTIKTMATVSISEIDALRYKNGEYNYERAKKVADNLSKAFIRIEDRENKKYMHINILERVYYAGGTFQLVFTDSAASMGFIGPKRDYTTVLNAVNKLSSGNSIRLYQNLKSRCFGKTDENGYYTWVVEVDRLKLLMGYINTEDEEFYKSEKEYGLDSDDLQVIDVMKKKMTNSGHGQKESPGVPYITFAEFRRKAVDPFVKEINEKMDISVRWEKVGLKWNRVEKIKFFIKPNDRNKPSDEEIKKMLFAMSGFITVNDIGWTVDQLRGLLEASGYDVKLVQDKYQMLLRQDPAKIKNRFGWVMDAVRFGFEDSGTVDDAVEVEAVEEDPFEKLWNGYPKRTRRDMITKKAKREIEAVGFEQVEKALENYLSVIDENHRNGFNRAYMSGGQFFTNGYKDYLPAVFDKMTDEEKGYIGNKGNKFTANEKRTSMDYAAMAEQEEMDKVLHGFD